MGFPGQVGVVEYNNCTRKALFHLPNFGEGIDTGQKSKNQKRKITHARVDLLARSRLGADHQQYAAQGAL